MSEFPQTAYISLWYPKPSETFIFYEMFHMRALGVPLTAHALYAALSKGLSGEMLRSTFPVERYGCKAAGALAFSFLREIMGNADFRKRIAPLVMRRKWSCLEKMGENWWALLCAPALARRFQALGVRHIHAAWANGPATAAWIVHMLTGIPFSFSARAGDICPPDGALCEKMEAASFVRVDSAHNIPYLSGLYPQFAHKIHLVRNPSSWSACREAPVAMGSPLKILALARFVSTKGLEYLIKAVKILDDQGIDVQLTLGGSGALEAPLKCLALGLGIKDRTHFPGFITHDKAPDYILDADVFVMPSVVRANGDRDGLPTVLMEALLHGVPVISTDVGGIREVVEDGVTGLLVPQRDPKALAEAVKRLKNDPAKARVMALQGKRRVCELYDTKRNVEELAGLYARHALASPAV